MNYYGPTERVKRLRERFLTYKPNVDIERAVIYTRLFKESDDLKGYPQIVAGAMAFAQFLKERTIYIEDDQLIAGSFGRKPRAFPIYPETQGDDMVAEYRKLPTRPIDPFEYPVEDQVILEEKLHKWHGTGMRSFVFGDMPLEDKRFFLNDPEHNIVGGTYIFSLDVPLNGPAGHINPDYQTVMEIGFQGIKAKAEARLQEAIAQKDEEGINFLKASIICCDAITDFGHRYAALARDMAAQEKDENRKKELLSIAEACDRVPGLPPRTFQECLQALWLTYVGIQMEAYERCFGCSRLDQYGYPFLKADLDAGRITEAQAQELLDCLWMKFPETNYINSEHQSYVVSGFPSQQQIIVGGQTPDGKDGTNLLSYMALQASINTGLHQPSISVRYFEDTPDEFLEQACRLAREGNGHPSFFNDLRCVPALVYKGVALEDARDYCSVGCASIQPTRKDKGTHNCGYLNVASALEFALHDGFWKKGNKQISIHTGNAADFKTFDELMDAFKKQMAYMVDVYSRCAVKVEQAHRAICPTPYISSFVQGCIEHARDKSAGGAMINSGPTPRGIGLGDVADSLTALKKWVFEEKKYTGAQVLDALEKDWEGYDELYALVNSEKTHHWCNDDDFADEIGQAVYNTYCEHVEHKANARGGEFTPGIYSVSTNTGLGGIMGASPDGRKAGEAISDNLSGVHTACGCHEVSGPTAIVNSVTKLDHSRGGNGTLLNWKFSPECLTGDAGRDNIINLIDTYFAKKGMHSQFNIISSETMKDAQVHPENYQDMLVRVAGFSAYFVLLSEPLQNDIIGRTELSFE